MPLLSIRTSNKIDTNIRLEESTAKALNQYAHFVNGTADAVVNEALEYVFSKDKDFQEHLTKNGHNEVTSTLRVKRTPAAKNSAPATR